MTAATTPHLSLVVPTYRATRQLRALLQSIAAQSYDPSQAEVIVVDDGTPGFDVDAWRGLAGEFALTVIGYENDIGDPNNKAAIRVKSELQISMERLKEKLGAWEAI